MRWYWPLQGVTIVLLFVSAALAYRFWLPLIVPGIVVFYVAGFSIRCPRCGLHVRATSRTSMATFSTPPKCVGCGRTKDDIWPFQWLIRPERKEP